MRSVEACHYGCWREVVTLHITALSDIGKHTRFRLIVELRLEQTNECI